MRRSLFIAPLLTSLLPVLVLYAVLLNSPRHIPLPSLKTPAAEPAGKETSFRGELASRLGADTLVIQSPAILSDLDADGKSEAVLYAHAFYHPEDAPPEGREWLLVIGNPPPTAASSEEFAILARRELRLSTSAPRIRLAPLFEDGSTAIILSEDERPTRLTDNWLFRYRPDSARLEPLRFSGGSIGGRSGPEAISGNIDFFRRDATLTAEVSYGRDLALLSTYRWNGNRFTLAGEELPQPAEWEAELIRRVAEVTEHYMLALQIYGDEAGGRAVAYSEDGHYGYYSLFEYRFSESGESGGGTAGALQLEQLDMKRGDPEPFLRTHGIDSEGGRGFYFLQSAERFVPSPEPVLP
jgi:hypothetical protein